MADDAYLEPPRRLKIDLGEVAFAMDQRLSESRFCLDRETGEVVTVGNEALREIEELSIELDTADDAVLTAAIRQRDRPDWEIDELLTALAVDSGFGTRFVEIPSTESHVAYRDMEGFIETVRDEQM
jgi:hypothetical protein